MQREIEGVSGDPALARYNEVINLREVSEGEREHQRMCKEERSAKRTRAP